MGKVRVTFGAKQVSLFKSDILSRQENEWKKISKRKQQQQKQKKKGKVFSIITHCTSLSRWNF